MIVGIGSDIVSIARMEKSISKHKDNAFAKQVLVGSEWEQYQTTKNKAALLAKRFAAKEAAAKALGTGFAEGITWRHIVTEHDDRGKPTLKLTDAALEKANELGVNSMHITISDEHDFAVAFVVLES